MTWRYIPWGAREYETAQEVVDDAMKFDELPNGTEFCLHEVATNRPAWFKVERRQAVRLPDQR